MNRMILLVGLPGCGKSTHAKKLYEEAIASGTNARIFSSDAIREELYGDESIVGNSNEVFTLLEKRLVAFIEANPNATAIYDATNLSAKGRKGFINRMRKTQAVCHFECHFIACRISECKRRQFSRDRQVPEEVIERMVRQFQAPYYNEGWDAIKIIEGGRLYDLAEEHANAWIPHDNPHHELTIGSHMATARREASSLTTDEATIEASYHHDIGKPHTKSFTNYKGETTEVAHYYGHESVSSYMWLCSNHDRETNEVILIGALIQWHMTPYFITLKGETPTHEALVEWGYSHGFKEEFSDRLWVIHQADQSAH